MWAKSSFCLPNLRERLKEKERSYLTKIRCPFRCNCFRFVPHSMAAVMWGMLFTRQQTLIFRFEFVSVPLVHPRYKREFLRIMPERPGPLTRSDQVLMGSDWCNLVVAKLSPWIDLDSSDEIVRKNSEKVSSLESHFVRFDSVTIVRYWPCKTHSCVHHQYCKSVTRVCFVRVTQ